MNSIATTQSVAGPRPRPGVDLAPAPLAPDDAPCGFCDIAWSDHGARYSALPGWHTWTKRDSFHPLAEYRRAFTRHLQRFLDE